MSHQSPRCVPDAAGDEMAQLLTLSTMETVDRGVSVGVSVGVSLGGGTVGVTVAADPAGVAVTVPTTTPNPSMSPNETALASAVKVAAINRVATSAACANFDILSPRVCAS